MKSINTYYIDLTHMDLFIQENSIIDSPSLLIQVFTAHNHKTFIKQLLKNMTDLLPQAVIIGSTTDGEIMNGLVSTHQTVLSFTQFDHTTLQTTTVKHKKDGFSSGQTIATSLMGEDTKLIIAFADGTHTNGEAFLEGMNSINSDVLVAGGLAADNAEFVKTYVFTKEKIIANGVVAVALNSKQLNVYNHYSFNWTPIGKELTITKVKDNRVYTIDDKTAVDTYAHYLSEEVAKGLPAVGVEFPLMHTSDGVMVARAVLTKYDDGSLGFAGNLSLGDKVTFGYGDPKKIFKASETILNDIRTEPSEAIFVYSCMARRHFMPSLIETETLPLNAIAPTSGFFTYGEFFTSKSKDLLNQSMTIISLSENTRISSRKREVSSQLIHPRNNSINALIHLVNVTSHEAMEQEVLMQAQQIFKGFFDNSPDGILVMENNKFVQCNQKMLDIFGYTSEEEFLNARLLQLFPRKQPNGQHTAIKIKEMRGIAREKGSHYFEFVYKKKDGQPFWADVMLTSIQLNDKDIIYIMCRDISQRKEMELELSHQKNTLYYQAHHDALTGLPNRTLFMKELEKGVKESTESDMQLALMFFDLDHFKQINDTLGHDVGDQVIQITGERLKRSIRNEDVVSRLGGDEFLILIKNLKKHQDIITKATQILETIEEPIFVDNQVLHTTASLGISRFPTDNKNAYNLLKYADTAMYKAKSFGGKRYEFYTSEMTENIYEDLIIEKDLREAMINNDFEVYYQPQINSESEKIVGIEALIRWNHSIVGILAPDIFLSMAAKTGLLLNLDLWVMKTAMREVSQWYAEGLSPGVLALNMGMTQLEYPELLTKVNESFDTYNFDPKWLEFEVTESEMMKNPEHVISILEVFHERGISIAIDDFGTGYSSLAYLKNLPIDTLKIDRSFISDVPNNGETVIIVDTMIKLAKNLGLSIVAEGVETQEQKAFLMEKGCSIVQGYYYSKPVNAREMKKMLKKQKV